MSVPRQLAGLPIGSRGGGCKEVRRRRAAGRAKEIIADGHDGS